VTATLRLIAHDVALLALERTARAGRCLVMWAEFGRRWLERRFPGF
jgi:hypothetical protein